MLYRTSIFASQPQLFMVRFFLNTFTPNAICTLVTLVCMQYILRPFKAFAYFAFHEKAIKSFDGVPVPVLSMALIHQQKG